MNITDEMRNVRLNQYIPAGNPPKQNLDPEMAKLLGEVERAWREGKTVTSVEHPTFIRDLPLYDPGILSEEGYEFLLNEFVGNRRVGKSRDGKIHILGSYRAVDETYLERGFAAVRLAAPAGDASALGPDFAVAVYAKRVN